jgi:hypothetical protein
MCHKQEIDGMRLHWQQLELHYGNSGHGGHELSLYKQYFMGAGWRTAGLLLCRYTEDSLMDFSFRGGHAEEQLIDTVLWRRQIPNALKSEGHIGDMINVCLVINRSPCSLCTNLLVRELYKMRKKRTATRDRFILAMRGAYEDRDMITATTHNGLSKLNKAGWDICVLQTGSTLPARGKLLLQSVQRIAGRGFIRLDTAPRALNQAI